MHQHKRGDPVQYDVVTATAPAAIVYVDQYGNRVDAPAASSAPAAVAPAYNTPAASSSAPSASPSKASDSSNAGYGITYSPYNSDGTCKSADQVNSDFASLDGYSLFRIYGCDCEQVPNVVSAVKAKKAKIFLGVYNIADVASEVQSIISAVSSDWSIVDTISIGNELVNQGTAASTVVAAINTARSLLTAAGYTGPVVTVDTFNAIIANPELCEASDYAAANCHAFFDSTSTASNAGNYVSEQAARVKEACGGKKVVITESGWPWKGDSNGAAVPSVENQQTAIASIKSKFDKDIILFSAYDDGWKKNFEGSFNCEQYWGFLGH
jgi:exo-beta-1,3-glucanase (GH17 family)